jgi:DNA replication licensing factor MCM5
MKKFISYARNKCAPTLTAGGAAMLANKYAEIRHQHMQREAEARTDSGGAGNPSVIPITVRQLEALIRITESVAKCSLSVDATEAHVDEAIRMFNVSTLSAAQSGMGGGEVLAAPLQEKVRKRRSARTCASARGRARACVRACLPACACALLRPDAPPPPLPPRAAAERRSSAPRCGS